MKKMAAAQHKSMAQIIRQAVDYYAKAKLPGSDNHLRKRAMAAAGCFWSGLKDLASSHDVYLAEIFDR